MNLDFDTIEIPEEKLNRTIQNNIKKVHGIHRKQMIRHTAGLFCAAAFFFCLSAIFLHSNPSLAADLLHLFEKIENKQRAWTAALCVEKEAPLSPRESSDLEQSGR